MKFLSIFALFIILHLAAWAGTHVWLSQQQGEILVVADTSFSMKPKFAAMEDWIDALAARSRYKTIVVGTDKAMLGKLDDLKATSMIFRTAFGRMSEDNLLRYKGSQVGERYLLSDGSVQPAGWRVVKF